MFELVKGKLIPELVVTAPWDGQEIARLDCVGPRQLESMINTAYGLYEKRDAWLPVSERIGILKRAARIMLRDKNRLAQVAAQEGGKPLLDSQFEVERAIDAIDFAINALLSDSGEVVPMQTTRYSGKRLAMTCKEPIGVVVAVSAFNHPLNLIVHQVISAVAAGCPVIVKPAPDTPLSCLKVVQVLREAGLPVTWCQVVLTEDIALAEKLVTDSRIGLFSFIGSPAVGWALRSKLAPGVRCLLEHGGAAPVILADDANWDLALAKLTRGAFYHAGQVCVSVQRIFVPEPRAVEFAEALAERASCLRLGDPRKSTTEVGPLIRQAEALRVHQWVQEAVLKGARLLCGGKSSGYGGYAPTVLLEPDPESRVSRREIFGPVACVYGYADMDDAIRRANSLPFAFQAAVFTTGIDTAMRAFRRLDASAVMINDDTTFRVDDMPFAGLRQSGLGTGGMRYSINEMRNDKMLILNSGEL